MGERCASAWRRAVKVTHHVRMHTPRATSPPTPQPPGISLPRMLARAPRLLPEIVAVRRTTPHLDGAAGRTGVAGTAPRHDHDDGDEAPDDRHEHHLLVMGDSIADGVGLDHHRDSIAGRLASRLSEHLGHPVVWHVAARSGADARGVRALLADAETHDVARRADAVIVTVGVNDVKNLHTTRAWQRDLALLLDDITALAEGPVALVGVPPMAQFPALPPRLAQTLGERARRFDALGRDTCARYEKVHHVALIDADLVTKKAFADDGFHPSKTMHKRLAGRIEEVLREGSATSR